MKRTKVKFNGQNMNTFLDSGMWPCSVCRSSVGSNSIFCSGCKHWVHKKCTRIRSRLVENVIFRTLFQKNTYGGLLLSLTFVTTEFSTSNFIFLISYLCKNRLNMSLSFLLSSLLGETQQLQLEISIGEKSMYVSINYQNLINEQKHPFKKVLYKNRCHRCSSKQLFNRVSS